MSPFFPISLFVPLDDDLGGDGDSPASVVSMATAILSPAVSRSSCLAKEFPGT